MQQYNIDAQRIETNDKNIYIYMWYKSKYLLILNLILQISAQPLSI